MITVYPSTFDPFTRGHENLVRRTPNIFDELIVGVVQSPNKRPFFALEKRIEIAREVLGHHPSVWVERFSNLLRNFVRKDGARVTAWNLRAVSDFEYEFQMADMNRYLLPDVKIMFLTPSGQYQFISGTFVRKIAVLGGDVSKSMFPSVEKWLKEKTGETEGSGKSEQDDTLASAGPPAISRKASWHS